MFGVSTAVGDGGWCGAREGGAPRPQVSAAQELRPLIRKVAACS